MASYPSGAFAPASKSSGQTIQAAHVNDVQAEITAVETALLTGGLAHALIPDTTAAARALGGASTAWGIAYVKGLVLSPATELTIASGAVTVTQSDHTVDTESNAATDDLVTLTAGSGVTTGMIVVLRAENVARVVTVKASGGNLLLNGDFSLSATNRSITLKYDGTNWQEIARSVSEVVTGSWTPVLGGSGGTSGQTYSYQVGRYVKLGQLVFATFNIALTAKGTITNDVQIQGLPFALENVANMNQGTPAIWFDALGTNWITVLARASGPAASALTLSGRQSAGTGQVTLVTADITNTTVIAGSITYRTDA